VTVVEPQAPIHLLTVENVFAMVEAGVIAPEDRCELVDGILYDIAVPGPTHSGVVARLTHHFARAATDAWEVRVQDVLFVPSGFRSPDLIVVPTTAQDVTHHTALLVVEVSHTTRARDEAKVSHYARADVDEYWRVDVDAAEIVVRRGPDGEGYRELLRFGLGESVSPLFDAPPVDVAALLRR
jgi:hypothetical protein